jgi:DNA-binding transcriptional ArsR family regulator
MDSHTAAKLFECLSAAPRLEVLRLLIKRAPDGVVAGEIARLLGMPATNLSFHLKGLVHSGLASMTREGRYCRYKANTGLMAELVDYLTSECCLGRPQECFGPPGGCPSPSPKLAGEPGEPQKS